MPENGQIQKFFKSQTLLPYFTLEREPDESLILITSSLPKRSKKWMADSGLVLMCMTVSAELKSSNCVTERNTNICVAASKLSKCSCTEAPIKFREGNTESLHGVTVKETDKVGDNVEDVDADTQCEPIR